MFFGYSKNGTQRDYAWVKQGMVFPFSEFMDRFQGQIRLYKGKPSDFRMALEEAMLAEDGVLESHLGSEEVTDVDAHPDGLMEATVSYVDGECYDQDQLHSMEKNGTQITKKLIYCAIHRVPNPDSVLVVHTPLGFSLPELHFKIRRDASGEQG